jgi:nicotinate-nucleotide adenylyltransferase
LIAGRTLPDLRPEADVKKRIGVFGGAFDPPHHAHVALAQAAVGQFGLDALHVIPTGQAWHKARALTAAEHRLAMARLAFVGVPNTVVDDRELLRAGPTFTIDTLEALQAEQKEAQLYLLMGADQFAAFGQWHRWDDIQKIAIICIAARARIDWADDHFDAKNRSISPVLRLVLPDMPISATGIRERVASGIDVSALVPVAVERYISTHRLYRNPAG